MNDAHRGSVNALCSSVEARLVNLFAGLLIIAVLVVSENPQVRSVSASGCIRGLYEARGLASSQRGTPPHPSTARGLLVQLVRVLGGFKNRDRARSL